MNGLETYQNTAVTTQSKGRLIVLLYAGAVKFLKLAMRAIEAVKSNVMHIWSETTPAGITPGQRTMAGTRTPPS